MGAKREAGVGRNSREGLTRKGRCKVSRSFLGRRGVGSTRKKESTEACAGAEQRGGDRRLVSRGHVEGSRGQRTRAGRPERVGVQGCWLGLNHSHLGGQHEASGDTLSGISCVLCGRPLLPGPSGPSTVKWG